MMLMSIAGDTSRSIGVQEKIAAGQTPQAILKSEILRCTDPAAQTVLEGKLRTLEQQARTETLKRTKLLLVAVGMFVTFFLIFLMFGHSHSHSP
jgi:hypothetical protein